MREYLHTLYQFTDRWVVDDTKFRTAFGDHATPLDDALATTLDVVPRPRRRPPDRLDTSTDVGRSTIHEHRRPPRPRPPRRGRDGRSPPSSPSPASPPSDRSSSTRRSSRRPPPTSSTSTASTRAPSPAWFLVLVISAALLAPAGILLGRLAGGSLGRWIAGVGIAAATVQVIGLSRWVLLVPGISDDATRPRPDAPTPTTRFELLHTWLGTVLGETSATPSPRPSPCSSPSPSPAPSRPGG